MEKKRFKKGFKIVWFSLVIVFLIWNWSTFQSRNLPKNTLISDTAVEVMETDGQIVFKPKKTVTDLEIIFFQGGLADPKAYAPLCRQIAENGYTCHLIKMPYRFPQKYYKDIAGLFDLKSGQYVLGGHSQGAKMAAQFVYEHPGVMKGLFLMGTSHPRDIDLSGLAIPTLKFYAENDGLASVGEVLENKSKLPSNTQLVPIKGGNHSQFGYLGTLLLDNKASISLERQQAIVLKNLVLFLNKIQADSVSKNESYSLLPILCRLQNQKKRLLS